MPRVPRAARLPLLRGVAVAAALAAAGGAAGSAHAITGMQHITGGAKIAITDAPWQVRLKIGSTGICGGSILDERHIVTAAHCTYSGLSALSTGSITVISGSSSFNPDSQSMAPNGPTPPDDAVISSVASIRRHPGYIASADGRTDSRLGRDDVAVLTLNNPLTIDGVVRKTVALPDVNTDLPGDSILSVTGFGLQSDATEAIDGKLYRLTDLRLLDAVAQTGEWNAVYITATSSTGLDCSGDSGGPLVQLGGPTAVLVGLVAFSPNCSAGTTSVFTKVSAGEIRDFITGNDTPPASPTGGRDILLSADKSGALPLRPGRVMTCFPGTWTHSPVITTTFFDGAGATLQEGPSQTYAVTAADVGKRIACRSVAQTAGGNGRSPATSFTPLVEPALAPAAAAAKAKLSVTLRVRTTRAYRGESVGITIRMYSRAKATAVNAQSCVTVPTGWRVRSRGGAKVYGKQVCLKTKSLRQYELLQTTISLRPKTNAKTGKIKVKVRAAADNAKAAFSSRTFRVS